jgi:hypothetical protein
VGHKDKSTSCTPHLDFQLSLAKSCLQQCWHTCLEQAQLGFSVPHRLDRSQRGTADQGSMPFVQLGRSWGLQRRFCRLRWLTPRPHLRWWNSHPLSEVWRRKRVECSRCSCQFRSGCLASSACTFDHSWGLKLDLLGECTWYLFLEEPSQGALFQWNCKFDQ